jgi:hypothetical protein
MPVADQTFWQGIEEAVPEAFFDELVFCVAKRACGESRRAKNDYAMLALLFGCGFRRPELGGLGTG